MAIVKIANVGAIGIIKDIPQHELPPEAWTDSKNIRLEAGKVVKFKGHEDVYTQTVSALTAVQTIAGSPWFAMPVQADTNNYWVYCTGTQVFVAHQTANRINLNKLDTTASATLLYSATPSVRWNGDVLAGIPVLNPTKQDSPQVWDQISLSNRLQDMQWDSSAGTSWATRTAGAVVCHSFRAYREYGVGMRTVEGGTGYPRRVRWSHPAVNNSQPDSWEPKASNDAGYVDLDDTVDYIVDGKQLRDTFYVYKENTTWSMQYVGGQKVMSFRPIFQFGALATDCVAEFFNKHVVLTSDRDIVLHNGMESNSLITNKWRNYLQNEIDINYASNCFLATNYEKREIWICYPQTGTAEAYWCTHALIWNWQDDTWFVRELPKASFIANGLVDFGDGGGVTNRTWDTITDTWDTIDWAWNERNIVGNTRAMLMCKPEDTASSGDTPQLLKLDSTEDFDGVAVECYVERTGLPVASSDRQGQPKVDLFSIKYVTEVWPYIDAADGTQIEVYIGSQMHLTDAITWTGPITYTVGTDHKVNCRVMARYLAFKFRTTGSTSWNITGYDINVQKKGRY